MVNQAFHHHLVATDANTDSQLGTCFRFQLFTAQGVLPLLRGNHPHTLIPVFRGNDPLDWLNLLCHQQQEKLLPPHPSLSWLTRRSSHNLSHTKV